MKKSVSFGYDIELAGNVTGFAAIACTCAKVFDKIKSLFGGNHGHSGLHASGVMHVEITQSIEYSPEEAKLYAEIEQESFNNLPENMDKLVHASKSFALYLRDETKEWVSFYDKIVEEQETKEKAKEEKERIKAEKKAKMETSAE